MTWFYLRFDALFPAAEQEHWDPLVSETCSICCRSGVVIVGEYDDGDKVCQECADEDATGAEEEGT